MRLSASATWLAFLCLYSKLKSNSAKKPCNLAWFGDSYFVFGNSWCRHCLSLQRNESRVGNCAKFRSNAQPPLFPSIGPYNAFLPPWALDSRQRSDAPFASTHPQERSQRHPFELQMPYLYLVRLIWALRYCLQVFEGVLARLQRSPALVLL